MARHTANVWIAYADLLFVLFLVVLLAGASFQETASKAEAEAATSKKRLEELAVREQEQRRKAVAAEEQARMTREQNARLRLELERRVQCADAEPLLRGLSECIARVANVATPIRADRCSLSLREDLLRFETRSAAPRDPRRARAIAVCVYDSAFEFRSRYPDAFRSIATISFDGHTDCEGEADMNMSLASSRGVALYDLLLRIAPRSEQRSRDGVLSKIAVRSFGLHRPVNPGRPCFDHPFEEDRRVTISVEMRPELGQAQVP